MRRKKENDMRVLAGAEKKARQGQEKEQGKRKEEKGIARRGDGRRKEGRKEKASSCPDPALFSLHSHAGMRAPWLRLPPSNNINLISFSLPFSPSQSPKAGWSGGTGPCLAVWPVCY